MPKELVISAAPHETRVAILEDGQLCEIYIEREKEFALVGSIYKGRVTRVLPGMQSAFVDIGLDSDAFLYVGDFLENLEDYDHVAAPAEAKVEKAPPQASNAFAQPPAGDGQPAEASPADATPQSLPVEEPGDAQPNFSGQPSDGSQSAPSQRYSAPPSSQPGAPRTPFGRQDRGSGNFGGQNRGNDRGGDRGGNDRGGRRRGGRWRRGGGGRDNERRPGRDLPPSKYASSASPTSATPRPFISRPYDPPPTEELPADFEPIILPGESLAKYKDRAPGSAPQSAQPAETTAAESSAVDAGLPSSLYAAPQESAHVEEPETFEAPEPEHSGSTSAFHEEPAHSEEVHALGGSSTELSDEEATALAEQLAEARHEEAHAEAQASAGTAPLDEEDPPAPETAAEAEEFVAEVEAQEHEEERDGGEEHDHEQDHGEEHPDDAQGNEYPLAAADDPTSLGNEADSPADQIGNVAPQSSQDRQPTSARISQPNNRARFQRPMRRGGRQRGRDNRPPRQHGGHGHQDSRPPQPQRRPQLISEMLKAGQEILVQIAKEPLGKKGARITSHVALPGRFLVYMPTVNHIGVSRRIGSAEERSRLRRLVTESKSTFPGGFIVRTAAEGAPDDEIRADVEFLGRTWEKTIAQAEPRKAPSLLHRDLNLVERILRDYVSNDYTAIWINSQEEFSKVVEFVNRFQPKLVDRVKLYTKSTPIFEEFGIQQELDKALRPKVWLKSGGYIVINHTEALVAIDVNTGKYVGRGSTRLEDTIVKTNLEAVKEIVRQIRLRDLGGIIILDFIDMEERRNREKVMSALDQALRSDRAPSKALPFNEFGLVAVTRKRTKQALERVLCQPCPYCTGSGMVKSVPTICYEIQAEARKMSPDLDASSLTLRVHPEIAKTLKTREAALIEELEQITRKSVIIQADPTLHWEQYDIY